MALKTAASSSTVRMTGLGNRVSKYAAELGPYHKVAVEIETDRFEPDEEDHDLRLFELVRLARRPGQTWPLDCGRVGPSLGGREHRSSPEPVAGA